MAVIKKTAPHEPFHEKLSLDLLLSYTGSTKCFSLPLSYIHHSLPSAFTPPIRGPRSAWPTCKHPSVFLPLWHFLSVLSITQEGSVYYQGNIQRSIAVRQGFEIRFRQVRSRMVHGIPPWRYTDVMIVVRETGKWNDSRKCQKQWKQKYRLN